MKHGSEYAKRLKRLLNQLTRKFGKPDAIDPVDPIDQLVIGILAGCTTHAKAQTIYRRLRQHVVDLNELRVTPAMELADQIGDSVPLARQKAQRIVDALNAIRKRQDSLDLTFLRHRGRREAREYLEALDGVDRATAASVVLFSLGGHAIPVDPLLVHVLKKEELVDQSADAAEVQTFLERCVNSAQAQAVYELLSRYAASRPLKISYEQLCNVPRELPSEPVPKGPAPAALSPPGAKTPPGKAAAPASQNAEASKSAAKAARTLPPVTRPDARKGKPAPARTLQPASKPAGNNSHTTRSPARKKK